MLTNNAVLGYGWIVNDDVFFGTEPNVNDSKLYQIWEDSFVKIGDAFGVYFFGKILGYAESEAVTLNIENINKECDERDICHLASMFHIFDMIPNTEPKLYLISGNYQEDYGSKNYKYYRKAC